MDFKTRKIVKGADLNGTTNLFGGRALAWIDEEAAIFAMCNLGITSNIVTKAMSAIDFIAPAKVGDMIEIGCKVVRFGRTSIVVECLMRNMTRNQNIIRVPEITFVCIDDNGIPVAHGVTEEK